MTDILLAVEHFIYIYRTWVYLNSTHRSNCSVKWILICDDIMNCFPALWNRPTASVTELRMSSAMHHRSLVWMPNRKGRFSKTLHRLHSSQNCGKVGYLFSQPLWNRQIRDLINLKFKKNGYQVYVKISWKVEFPVDGAEISQFV